MDMKKPFDGSVTRSRPLILWQSAKVIVLAFFIIRRQGWYNCQLFSKASNEGVTCCNPSCLSFESTSEMGRVFLSFLCGPRLFLCAKCRTPLTTDKELCSTGFVGSTGRAYLFNRAINIRHSQVHHRVMTTGPHYVRDVYCKSCNTRLGWMYEFAIMSDQVYKEGCVILEQRLFVEVDNTVTCNDVSCNCWRKMEL